MNLITIIVPMFNEEKNIKNCIATLKSQSNPNFNVIFIDDGSTDQTVAQLKKELKSKINFQYDILQQTNQGAAAARESGIKKATTDYIMFYDCDDLLSTNIIESFYKVHNNYDSPDIIIPLMLVQNGEGDWKELKFFSTDKVINHLDCVKYSFNQWKVHGCFAIKRNIILKSYLNYNKYNPEGVNFINNDEVITRLNFLNSRIIVKSDAIYYYCYNSNSTTKRINELLYLKINNALIMNEIYSRYSALNRGVKAELISTLWGTFILKQKYKSKISNPDKWEVSLKRSLGSLNYLDLIRVLPFKQKVQFSILKFIYNLN